VLTLPRARRYASYGLAFFWGASLILRGQATSGQIVGVFFSVLIGAFALAELAPKVQSITFAIAAATSLFNTIDRVPVIDSSSEAGLKPKDVNGVITVNNLDFFYPSRPSVQVLYNFSATFPRGKTTALVGGSGSGKSTIVSLVERF
jgi:ATP-binding cassette subfamily B (MDR/TAP) protein 1